MKTVLTIAGSDSSGGAGIQADLKTMLANGVYGMSAITALTAQNTTGVQGVLPVPSGFLALQLDSVFTDIVPDAVKVGMTAGEELIGVIADKLVQYGAKRVVIDPVMVSTSGTALLPDTALESLKERLFPLAALITPNLPEAEVLAGRDIRTPEAMERAAEEIGRQYGCAVLCKGGHREGGADDLLYHNGALYWFYGKRIGNPNTHGTGCTLSSAIASNLAKGQTLPESVANAKEYLSGALAAMLELGKGNGPLHHGYRL